MPDRRSPGIEHAENVPGRPKLPEEAAVWKLVMFLSWVVVYPEVGFSAEKQ